ncbi:hypothetical protein DPMN_082377 [Dreissena polymorpha]|uniref:EF-hand domain-containing protein n=1 Tax=Dreissena polymorpha TaxID=45954 RepID=A0A9D3Y823_DREPO|nr:hypothetical protein DPMN_082377 [Dreissena polymorpha]
MSRREFLDAMMQKPIRSFTLLQTFQQHDMDGRGWLSRSEIRAVLLESNVCEPEDVADLTDQVFKEADLNNDGRITFTEFMKALS